MKGFDLNETARRIRALRKEKNIDQNTKAREIDVSNASVSYWENAKQMPSAEIIYKLAIYFNVLADYILGIIEED